jgi:hypothetical protein
MSDRMPEDLPVRKCINVMVGITRSKVIGLASPLAFLQEVEACSVGQSSQTCKLWTNKEAVCGGRILGYKLRCRFMRILHYYMIFTCMHINRTTKLFNATSIFVSCAYFAKRCLDTSGLVFLSAQTLSPWNCKYLGCMTEATPQWAHMS